MSEQNINCSRTQIQNNILNLEEKYMNVLESIITSDMFKDDLKNIEQEIQEYYEILSEAWNKKNKIKEASERLLRHHMYSYFESTKFYPSPISCDIALELDDIILNVDVKTIDKIGNSGELNSTQLEHNQTSFINEKVMRAGEFPGLQVPANLNSIDPRTDKPILTFLIKIGYADSNDHFNFLNNENDPSLVLTCIPNGQLSELFGNDLFVNFKDYLYYGRNHGLYYSPRRITTSREFNNLDTSSKFLKIESSTDIPSSWHRIVWENNRNNKIGYYDIDHRILWWPMSKKESGHNSIFLKAVKGGNTFRFKDTYLEKRYNSQNEEWSGERKYYNIYS